MNMSTHPLYNDFPTFLRKYFPYKVQKISLNAGFTCPNRDGTKGGAVVPIVITRPLILIIAGQRSRSLLSWRKVNVSLPVNILK